MTGYVLKTMDITKRKLLIILYTGREGSSAIVEGLRNSNEVYVPVFEEFDEYLYNEKFPNINLLSSLSNIERLKDTSNVLWPFYADIIKNSYVICFKWRPWGDVNILNDLADIYDLRVIFLTRKSAIAHTLRHLASGLIYDKLPAELQAFTNRDLHLQFLKFDKNENYPVLISAIDNIRIDVSYNAVRDVVTEYTDSKITLFDTYIRNKNKYKSKVLFFEDFTKNPIDVFSNIATFIEIKNFDVKKYYEKSDLDISVLINNYREIIDDLYLRTINEKYISLIGK